MNNLLNIFIIFCLIHEPNLGRQIDPPLPPNQFSKGRSPSALPPLQPPCPAPPSADPPAAPPFPTAMCPALICNLPVFGLRSPQPARS